jgi:hypothetical protein
MESLNNVASCHKRILHISYQFLRKVVMMSRRPGNVGTHASFSDLLWFILSTVINSPLPLVSNYG